MAEQMVFFRSYYEAVADFDNDIKLEVLESIIRYGLYGEEPTNLSPISKMAFTFAKPSLEKSARRGEAARENGKKGGRTKPNETQENPKEPNETQENPKEPNETQENPKEPHNIVYDKDFRIKTLDKDIDKDKDNMRGIPAECVNEITSRWNTLPGNVPKLNFIKCGTQRYKMLKQRIEDYGIDNVIAAIDNVSKSQFLLSGQGWFTFDWFIKPNNFVKVLEGNYNHEEEPKQTVARGISIIDDMFARGDFDDVV